MAGPLNLPHIDTRHQLAPNRTMPLLISYLRDIGRQLARSTIMEYILCVTGVAYGYPIRDCAGHPLGTEGRSVEQESPGTFNPNSTSHVLPPDSTLEDSRRGCSHPAGRHLQRNLLQAQAANRNRARPGSTYSYFPAGRHFQGAEHPVQHGTGGRMGTVAEHKSHVRRPDSPLIYAKRSAGDAAGSPVA